MPRALIILVLIAFAALSGAALWHHGYWGIFKPQLQSFAGAQVLVDLVISLSLFLVWMFRDAKASGRNPWPWLVIALTLGSFGPLLYLLTRKNVTAAA